MGLARLQRPVGEGLVKWDWSRGGTGKSANLSFFIFFFFFFSGNSIAESGTAEAGGSRGRDGLIFLTLHVLDFAGHLGYLFLRRSRNWRRRGRC